MAAPRENGRLFASGVVNNAQGGTSTLKLNDTPVSTRFVRVLMTESSNTCDEHGSGDIRNCVGYAIQQVSVGTVDASGASRKSRKIQRRKALRFVLRRSIPGILRKMHMRAAATSTAVSIFSSPAD